MEVTDNQCDRIVSLRTLQEWNEKLAYAIGELGIKRFPECLVDAIETVVPTRCAFLLLYRHKACPVHLYPNIRTERARQGIRRFF